MACVALAPFELAQSPAVERILSTLTLAACAASARIKHQHYGEEYPGDEYGALHAAAVLGLYAVLNLQISSYAQRAIAAPFYWFTYVMIWIVPALGLLFALRERNRWLLDASLVMALATLATNKPYVGLQHHEWDPVLLGALLIGGALILRRWLAGGPRGMRHGITASRILRTEKDRIALVGLASGFHDAPAGVHAGVPASNPYAGDGGRAGGGGADGSF
jgi:uncharacterized membrane protein YgcG